MKVWTCIFLITFFINKVHFEKVTKGTPLSGFLSQNNLHVSTQLINTLSPPGLILLIISALLHALITWQSYESHSKSHESNFVCFFSLFGGSTFSSREYLALSSLMGEREALRGTHDTSHNLGLLCSVMSSLFIHDSFLRLRTWHKTIVVQCYLYIVLSHGHPRKTAEGCRCNTTSNCTWVCL